MDAYAKMWRWFIIGPFTSSHSSLLHKFNFPCGNSDYSSKCSPFILASDAMYFMNSIQCKVELKEKKNTHTLWEHRILSIFMWQKIYFYRKMLIPENGNVFLTLNRGLGFIFFACQSILLWALFAKPSNPLRRRIFDNSKMNCAIDGKRTKNINEQKIQREFANR